MFSASLEVVLTIAYREALSRHHAYVTLEHLLLRTANLLLQEPREGEALLMVF